MHFQLPDQRSGFRALIRRPSGAGLCHIIEARDYQAGPTRLMAGAEAASVLTVKIFIEEQQIPPMRIIAEAAVIAMTRPSV